MSGNLRLSAAAFLLSLMALSVGFSSTQTDRTLVFPAADSTSSQLTPTLAPNVTATPTPQSKPTPTPAQERTIATIETSEPTAEPVTATPEPDPTSVPLATVPPTAISTMTPEPTPTPLPTATVIPTASPTQSPTPIAILTLVPTPTIIPTRAPPWPQFQPRRQLPRPPLLLRTWSSCACFSTGW